MRFIALAVLIASTSALACPDLTGNYQSCKGSEGEVSSGMELNQRIENGATIYQSISVNEETGEIEKQDMIADGKSRTVVESDGYSSTNSVQCVGDQLIVDSKFHDPMSGFSGSMILSVKKEGSKLITTGKGQVAGQEFEETTICE